MCPTALSFTISWSLLKLMSIELVIYYVRRNYYLVNVFVSRLSMFYRDVYGCQVRRVLVNLMPCWPGAVPERNASTGKHGNKSIELEVMMLPTLSSLGPESIGNEGSYGAHWGD